MLLGALGYPNINPMPTQWPQGTFGNDYTTYVDFHPLSLVNLAPFSQYQVSARDPADSPSQAELLFSISPNYTALDNWQMGPTTDFVKFLKIAVNATPTLPVILSSAPAFGSQTNGFGFIVSWATNATVVVETSTDLANPKWSAIATNTLSNGTVYLSDPHWTNYPSRFYRVRSP